MGRLGEEVVAKWGGLAATGELRMHREGSEGHAEHEERVTGMWPAQTLEEASSRFLKLLLYPLICDSFFSQRSLALKTFPNPLLSSLSS